MFANLSQSILLVLAMEQVLVTDPTLARCTIGTSELEAPLSAAGVQTTRLAALSRSTFALGSGQRVFRIDCPSLRKKFRRSPEREARRNDDDSDYLLPTKSFSANIVVDLQHSTHRSEVMSMSVREDRFASIDADGACIVSVGLYEEELASFALQPASLSGGEPGWAGVALQGSNAATTVTARQYYRDLSLYDRDILVRTIHTLLEPAALSFLNSSNTLVVAEGLALAMYDTRSPQRSSCNVRKMPSSSQLFAVDTSEDGLSVAVAGKDRTVHVFDTRGGTFRERWPACLKYEVGGLKMSCNQGMAYVCGVDNEVAYGAWCSNAASLFHGQESLMLSGANTKSPRRACGFRADGRITGLDVFHDDDGELLAVMSEVGALYVLQM